MKLKVKTKVNCPINSVWEGFTEELFLSLNPPFPPVKLLRFDGSLKGDIVSLELNFILFKQQWISEITEDYKEENKIGFVDKGVKLPFFLKKWQHHHLLVKDSESSTIIVDDIDFSTGTVLTDLLFYPSLLLQFLYRIPKYKSFFANRKNHNH